MLNTDHIEDRQIRAILITASGISILAFLAAALLVAVMVSENFNILNWME